MDHFLHRGLTPRADPLDLADPDSCSLIGPTAIAVQILMGALVLLSLLYKRHRERPKRAWWIWAFDVGKQVVGQASIHVSNVVISWIGASRGEEGNACAWYLVNILVDTTLGVGLIYVSLHLLTNLLSDRLGIPGLVSGEYGHPPKWSFFLRQLVVYLLSLAIMKLLVLGLFALLPMIMQVGSWMLEWTEGNWALQVVVVMGLVPITMNVLQFWLIDSIVKSKMLPFAPAPAPVPEDPTDERDPLMAVEGVEREYEEDGEIEDGPTLTGKKILDDLEAQRGNVNGNGNGKVMEGESRSASTSSSSATIRPSKPTADRRSSVGTVGTVESYTLGPLSSNSQSNGQPSGPSTHFRVPTLHVTKPSESWDWNGGDEWGEEDPRVDGVERQVPPGRRSGEDEEDGVKDPWGSMTALNGREGVRSEVVR